MAIFSEILRFILSPTKTKGSKFLRLRQHIATPHGIQDQYIGYVVPVQGAGLPVGENEMCWVIQWPHSPSTTTIDILSRLNGFPSSNTIEHNSPRSLLFSFPSTSLPSLNAALTAPICEIAIINLLSSAPRSDNAFKESMQKMLRDCYQAEGFMGGGWAYAMNGNNSDDVVLNGQREESQELAEEQRRLACYYLGWESIEHHHKYSQTALFAEDIDKLAPHFGPGTGAWYVKFEKHV